MISQSANSVKLMDFNEAIYYLHQPDDGRAIRRHSLVDSEKRFYRDGRWRVLRTREMDFDEDDYGYKQLWNGILTIRYKENVISIELASGADAVDTQIAFHIILELAGWFYQLDEPLYDADGNEIQRPHFQRIEGEVHDDDGFKVKLTFDIDMERHIENLTYDGCSFDASSLAEYNSIQQGYNGLRRALELQHP